MGIGDWGYSVASRSLWAKLALYTAGNVDPAPRLAVSLPDVGTHNASLGPIRSYHPDVATPGGAVRNTTSSSVALYRNGSTVISACHSAFRDFRAGERAEDPEHIHGLPACSNDDMQGTGAVVLAAVYSSLKVTGVPLRDRAIVVLARHRKMRIADQIRDAMVADGATLERTLADRQARPVVRRRR